MSDWSDNIAEATAEAERVQAQEAVAEARFDAVYAQSEADGTPERAPTSEEFHLWMAARKATDAAWGSWSMVMDSKPA
jgi:hypothetical protein